MRRNLEDVKRIVIGYINIETDNCIKYPTTNENGYGDILKN